MGILSMLWDDVVAGPQPEKGLGRLRKEKLSVVVDDPAAADDTKKRMLERKLSLDLRSSQEDARKIAQGIAIAKPPLTRSMTFGSSKDSQPSTPTSSSLSASPSTPSPRFREKDNVWRSVFHPGSNKAMDRIGSAKFDNAPPNSPTVYDWLYSGETKSKWR